MSSSYSSNIDMSNGQTDRNLCRDVSPQFNPPYDFYDGSLDRHFSNEQYIQHILKMYNEEIQNCERGKTSSSYAPNECLINNKDDMNNSLYLNNTNPLSNCIDLENLNNRNTPFIEFHIKNYMKENGDVFDHRSRSLFSLTNSKSNAKHNRYIDYNKQNSGRSVESNQPLENVSLDKTTEMNIQKALSMENNNEFTNAENAETENENSADENQQNNHLNRENISQEHILLSDPTLPKNAQHKNIVPNSLTSLIHKNIFSAFKCKPFYFIADCCTPGNYADSRAQSQEVAIDNQLNYSSASSSNEVLYTHSVDRMNKYNGQLLPVPSPKDLNESVNHYEPPQLYTNSEISSKSSRCTSPNQSVQLKNASFKEKNEVSENAEKKIALVITEQFYKEFLSKTQSEQKIKGATVDAMSGDGIDTVSKRENCVRSEIFYNKKQNTPSMEQGKPKTYSLQDIKSGKVEMPQTIFKPLPMDSVDDNVVNAYSKNKKIQNFMNDCNESTSLILKYPKIENKTGKTLYMPPGFTPLVEEQIGMPIIYEDDFDRRVHHPNVVNLHMGRVFEKHMFSVLKNKNDLGKKLFSERDKFKKYNYKNDQGFWISNIDKNRLVNPEQNNSRVTELVYETENSYEQEMEILKKCPNYDKIVPPVQDLYNNNNFSKFLWDQKIYEPNLKPDIATIMRRYDVEAISDYKIAHMSFGIDPVYKYEANYN